MLRDCSCGKVQRAIYHCTTTTATTVRGCALTCHLPLATLKASHDTSTRMCVNLPLATCHSQSITCKYLSRKFSKGAHLIFVVLLRLVFSLLLNLIDRNLRGYHRRPSLLDEIRTKSPGDFGSWSSGSILCLVSKRQVPADFKGPLELENLKKSPDGQVPIWGVKTRK